MKIKNFIKLDLLYPDKKNRIDLIRNFIDTILNSRTKPIITLKEQIDLMSVCFAVDKSLKLNRSIKNKLSLTYAKNKIFNSQYIFRRCKNSRKNFKKWLVNSW